MSHPTAGARFARRNTRSTSAGGRFHLTRQAGFWAVAASTAVLTAFSTAPSPLYGLYQRQDRLSSVTITVVYGVYAAGIVVSLLLVGHISDWYGRRPVLIPALLTALVASVIFTFSTSLPALVVGRVLTGLALGAAIATATAYVTDLDAGPGGPTRRSEVVATIANIGGLAVGPLIAGLLAQYLHTQLTLIWMIFDVLLVAAILAVAAAPEGRAVPQPPPRYRPQRLSAPAGARAQFSAALTGIFLCFAVFGVFAGLAGQFLAGPLRHSSAALAGLAIFVAFGVGALTQIATTRLSIRRLITLGVPVLIVGLAALVAAAWVNPPSLALFLIGAAIVGVGSGCIFRATLTVVITTAAPDDRAGALAFFFVVGYLGISLPVVGAGIALQHVSLRVILLVFGLAITAGILIASPVLLRLRPARGDQDSGR